MSKIYMETTFEAAIEHNLISKGGYIKTNPDTFDRRLCIDPTVLIPFIKETQSKEWEYLENIQKEKAEETLVSDLVRALDSEHEGCLKVLRHGFKCFGRLFRVAYFSPVSSMNPETRRLCEQNRLTITRQLHYSEKHEKSIDVVLGLNGIPVATAELKNPMTGQTWQNAIHQYKNDRDPNDLIFTFRKRSLVHFAVDPDEVYMTNRLSGKNTRFLPFNTGRGQAQEILKIPAGTEQPISGNRYYSVTASLTYWRALSTYR